MITEEEFSALKIELLDLKNQNFDLKRANEKLFKELDSIKSSQESGLSPNRKNARSLSGEIKNREHVLQDREREAEKLKLSVPEKKGGDMSADSKSEDDVSMSDHFSKFKQMIKFDSNDKKEIKELESKVMELENELIRKNSELACLQDKSQITKDELAKNNQDFQEINAQIDELKNQLEFYERANLKLLDQLTVTEEQLSRSEKDFNCTITDLKRTMELKERQMLFIYHGYMLDLVTQFSFLNQSNIALQRALASLRERGGNDRGQATNLDGAKARESRRILDLRNQLHDQEILYRNKHVTDFQNLQDLHHKEVLEITRALTSLRHRNTELEDEISHIKHLLHDVTTEVQIKNSILKSCFGVLDKNITKSNYDPEVLSRYLEKHPKSAKTAMETFLDILDSKIYNLAYMRDK